MRLFEAYKGRIHSIYSGKDNLGDIEFTDTIIITEVDDDDEKRKVIGIFRVLLKVCHRKPQSEFCIIYNRTSHNVFTMQKSDWGILDTVSTALQNSLF